MIFAKELLLRAVLPQRILTANLVIKDQVRTKGLISYVSCINSAAHCAFNFLIVPSHQCCDDLLH